MSNEERFIGPIEQHIIDEKRKARSIEYPGLSDEIAEACDNLYYAVNPRPGSYFDLVRGVIEDWINNQGDTWVLTAPTMEDFEDINDNCRGDIFENSLGMDSYADIDNRLETFDSSKWLLELSVNDGWFSYEEIGKAYVNHDSDKLEYMIFDYIFSECLEAVLRQSEKENYPFKERVTA